MKSVKRVKRISPEDVLLAVIRQALVMDDLTSGDVLDQIEALGYGDLVAKADREIKREGVAR